MYYRLINILILNPAVPMSTSPGVNPDEGGSPSVLQQNQEVWRRLKVDPAMLTQWNANLRMVIWAKIVFTSVLLN